jgi:membrane protease YdiL (CAAX protease family)
LQAICLALFLLYYLFQVITNLKNYQKLIDSLRDGRMKRMELYQKLVMGLWIPALVICIVAAFGFFPWRGLGVGIRSFGCPAWLFYTCCALAGVYLVYVLLSFFTLRSGYKKGERLEQGIPERMRLMMPATAAEKKAWVFTSMLVGTAEEFLFRGFLFYGFLSVFPALPVYIVLILSTLLFGAGHLYQGPKEAIKPLVVGALFGLFYIAFGTIWPGVILHALQDICAVYAV